MNDYRKALLAVLTCSSFLLVQVAEAGGRKSRNEVTAQPIVSFSADQTEYRVGERAQLSWASEGTRSCVASGDWEGRYGTSGAVWTAPLDGPKSYHLRCKSRGGSVEATVVVAVVAVPEPILPAEPEPAPELEPTPAPVVALNSAASEIGEGGSTTLNWSASNADECTARGGWSGQLGANGTRQVGPLYGDTTFSLSCTGIGGTAAAAVSVSVVPAPSISFTAADGTVSMGGTTALSWSSSHADSCLASGGWSGARGEQGSEVVGPINGSTTFTLSCEGIGGSAVRMVSVSALGEVSISWVAPSENTDGSPLTDLSGFRIYYGTDSRAYDDRIDIMDTDATRHAFNVASGDYYLTMTALDAEGNESTYANEILRSVP